MTSDPFNVVGRSALDSVEMAYAREVMSYITYTYSTIHVHVHVEETCDELYMHKLHQDPEETP